MGTVKTHRGFNGTRGSVNIIIAGDGLAWEGGRLECKRESEVEGDCLRGRTNKRLLTAERGHFTGCLLSHPWKDGSWMELYIAIAIARPKYL